MLKSESYSPDDPGGITAEVIRITPYGHLVSNLPDELRERHARIYSQAISDAREKGWNPDDAFEGDI